jgi:hypothetical protein
MNRTLISKDKSVVAKRGRKVNNEMLKGMKRKDYGTKKYMDSEHFLLKS